MANMNVYPTFLISELLRDYLEECSAKDKDSQPREHYQRATLIRQYHRLFDEDGHRKDTE